MQEEFYYESWIHRTDTFFPYSNIHISYLKLCKKGSKTQLLNKVDNWDHMVSAWRIVGELIWLSQFPCIPWGSIQSVVCSCILYSGGSPGGGPASAFLPHVALRSCRVRLSVTQSPLSPAMWHSRRLHAIEMGSPSQLHFAHLLWMC